MMGRDGPFYRVWRLCRAAESCTRQQRYITAHILQLHTSIFVLLILRYAASALLTDCPQPYATRLSATTTQGTWHAVVLAYFLL